MRLVFFIDSLKKIGGGSYAQFMFARQLARMGHNVIIFAGDRNFLSEDLNEPNLEVNYRPSMPRRRLTKLWSRIHEFMKVEPYLKEHGADWLIGYMRISAIRAARLGRKYDIRVANFVFETPLWIEEHNSEVIDGALKRSWEEAKKAYDASDILIPNSVLAGEKLLEWLPTARVSEPVYPGVEVPEEEQAIGERDIDIIYVGRLREHKNVDLIFRNADPSMKIVIIGSGDQEASLKDLAQQKGLNVSFLGAVSDSEKWNHLRRSKLMVFPSAFEGFGMPPLEALACGCQVLCSDIPIFKEIYGNEVSYFELKNPVFSTLIRQMLDNSPSRERSRLADQFTWKNSGAKIETILTR